MTSHLTAKQYRETVKAPKRKDAEHAIQTDIVKFLDAKLPRTHRFVAVSNNPRSRITGAREKARGMRKGFPDGMILGPDFLGLIEVKAEGEYLRPHQREWRDWCMSQGIRHAVCRSVDDARDTLAEWGLA